MMKKVNMLWMLLLLGALMIGTLAGVAGAGPNARPEASPALVNHMISAHHCIPLRDTVDWEFDNDQLHCDTASCWFYCPLKPPHEGLIRVQRLAMYAFDNGPGDLCTQLVHMYPKAGISVKRLVAPCTTDNVADPQVGSYNPANFKVSVLQDIHAWVYFSGTTQKLYGFKLKYEPL
jgi:hypothetical protein